MLLFYKKHRPLYIYTLFPSPTFKISNFVSKLAKSVVFAGLAIGKSKIIVTFAAVVYEESISFNLTKNRNIILLITKQLINYEEELLFPADGCLGVLLESQRHLM